jgi:hypothetical protein
MTRATYDISIEGDFLCIMDRNDGGRSVTNAAEDVVAEVAYLMKERGERIDRYAVIYRDTMGHWDQLVIANGKFQAFKSLGATNDRELAKSRAIVPA